MRELVGSGRHRANLNLLRAHSHGQRWQHGAGCQEFQSVSAIHHIHIDESTLHKDHGQPVRGNRELSLP